MDFFNHYQRDDINWMPRTRFNLVWYLATYESINQKIKNLNAVAESLWTFSNPALISRLMHLKVIICLTEIYYFCLCIFLYFMRSLSIYGAHYYGTWSHLKQKNQIYFCFKCLWLCPVLGINIFINKKQNGGLIKKAIKRSWLFSLKIGEKKEIIIII